MDFTQYMFTYPCRLQLRCQPDGMLMVVIVFWDYLHYSWAAKAQENCDLLHETDHY